MSWLKKYAKQEPLSLPAAPAIAAQTGRAARILGRRHTPLHAPARPIRGSDFHNGAFLRKFTEHTVTESITFLGKPKCCSGVMQVASVCTGSANDCLALDALSAAMKREGLDLGFEICFNCELRAEKRTWINDVHSALHPDKPVPCNFTDINELTTSARLCSVHGKRCRLPSALDGIIGGLSCKDYARCNSNKPGGSVYQQASSPGRSADCMHGLLALVDSTHPEWLLLENTDQLAVNASHTPDLDLFMHDLSSRGYEIKVFVLESSDFVLPQARVRCYITAVLRPGRMFSIADYQSYFKHVEELVERVKLCGPGLGEILFPDSDQAVQGALEARQKQTQKSVLTSRTMNEHRAAWAVMGMRFTTGVDRIAKADGSSPWYQSLCAAKQARLQYHQHVNAVKLREAGKSPDMDIELLRRLEATGAVVDLHPSLSFMSAGVLSASSQLITPTILPDSDYYVSIARTSCLAYGTPGVHRCIISEEMLMLNGWCTRLPRLNPVVAKRSNHFLADLGGNAFSSTVIAAMVCSITFAAEMKQDERAATSSEDAAVCMQLLKRARTDAA